MKRFALILALLAVGCGGDEPRDQRADAAPERAATATATATATAAADETPTPEPTVIVETPTPVSTATPVGTSTRAKAAFIKKADAICAETYASMKEASQKALKGVIPGTPEGAEALQEYARTALDLVEPMYERLAELKAPKEDREFLVVYLASAREHVKLARQELAASRKDSARAKLAGILQKRQKEAAKSYGFTVCDAA
jgi:hypothetical protein